MSTTNPVPKLYQSVVDDVINGVREAFLDEGVDEQVLTELQQLWESKLQQSKAIEGPNKDQEKLMAVYTQVHNTVLKQQQQHQQQKQQLQHSFHHSQQQQNSANTAGASQPVAASQQIFSQNQSNISNHGQAAALALPSGMLPQQLSNLSQLPAGQTITLQTAGGGTAQFILQAPVMAPQGQGQTVVPKTSPTPGSAPTQQQQQPTSFSIISGPPAPGAVSQTTGSVPPKPQTGNPQTVGGQFDGANDTSSDDDDDDDADDDDEDDDNVNDEENEEQGEEEEPLNTDDDVSEEDPSELFDAEHVVVCQYDKITRSKNKWKFHLKDGLMNLNGRDYVFSKATGEAEW